MQNFFKKSRITVIGDVILDRYLFGESNRISPEAPVPIVNVVKEVEKLGGAGNVARNAVRLGADVTLMGVVGDDEESGIIQKLALSEAIKLNFIKADCRTIVKSRILAQGQQLLRLDFEQKFSQEASNQLVSEFQGIINKSDLIVASDYGKGALLSIREIINICNLKDVPIVIDPKGDNFEKYTGATLITPNKKEFETVVGKCNDLEVLEKKALELINNLNINYLLVTRGSEGMSLVNSAGHSYHIKAQASDVYDVTGAGDTVCAVMAVAMASSDYKMEEATDIANTAAGMVVKKMGAAIIEPYELEWAFKNDIYKMFQEVEPLVAFCKNLRAQGKKIVFTNGCFDIIHAGHVKYLKESSELGDILVVGINSDASVRRQKGPRRPINNFKDRANVLCALSSVDFVIEFKEDNPMDLIKSIQPDVLVKGGDYREEDIVGYDYIIGNGGEVRSLGFYPENSTSKLIKKMNLQDK